MQDKRIVITVSGKQYEIQSCQLCKVDLVKRKYESIKRYTNRKLCSQACTKVYLKKNKLGWFGNDILPTSSKRKSKRQRKEAFMNVLQGILENPKPNDTPKFKAKLKREIKKLKKEICQIKKKK